MGAASLVNPVLRNEGLESREMVEQKNIALPDGIIFIIGILMQLDVELQ
jgi:hypothetical protein